MKSERLIKNFNNEYGYDFKIRDKYLFADSKRKIILKVVMNKWVYMGQHKEEIELWRRKGYVYVVFDFEEFKRKHFDYLHEHIILNI